MVALGIESYFDPSLCSFVVVVVYSKRSSGSRCPAASDEPLWVNSLCFGICTNFDSEFRRFEYRKLESRIVCVGVGSVVLCRCVCV